MKPELPPRHGYHCAVCDERALGFYTLPRGGFSCAVAGNGPQLVYQVTGHPAGTSAPPQVTLAGVNLDTCVHSNASSVFLPVPTPVPSQSDPHDLFGSVQRRNRTPSLLDIRCVEFKCPIGRLLEQYLLGGRRDPESGWPPRPFCRGKLTQQSHSCVKVSPTYRITGTALSQCGSGRAAGHTASLPRLCQAPEDILSLLNVRFLFF